MTEFGLAIIIFFVSHLIPAIAPLRKGLVRLVGERGFLMLFSTVSTGLLIWIGFAYANAPYVVIWASAGWMYNVPVMVMPIACILMVAGLTSPNPFSLGAGSARFDPAKPGIVSLTHHPVLWALIAWSGAHMVPNGDVASILFFGMVLVLTFGGMKTIERRKQARMGEEKWQALTARTPTHWMGFCTWRLIAGLALYGLLLWGHETVIGVTAISP